MNAGMMPTRTVVDNGNLREMIPPMRPVLFLLLGAAVGIAGATLFRGSLPPPGGSPEARILELENTLRETKLQLARIDPAQARPREDGASALGRGVRQALDDLKAGRPVDMNLLFHAAKPFLRDFFPLFDNIRKRDEQHRFDSMSGEYARKYNLSPAQQEELKQWLQNRSDQNAMLFQHLVLADGARFEDLVKATRNQRWDDGIDGFMEGQLDGDRLAAYRRDRMTQRAERVQQEADWRMQRLHQTVNLDEAQQDQVFSIMARSSKDFDPSMQIEGVSTDADPGNDRNAAIMEVLRPDQRDAYTAWRDERAAHARREFEEIGLKMPEGWDAIDDD